LEYLATKEHERVEVILQWLQSLIVEHMGSGVLPIAPPIMSRVFQELETGIVKLHDCMKIKKMPFPFPYAQMVSTMLLVSTIATPIYTGLLVKHLFWKICLTFMVIFAFWSINYIAAEIEMPFGEDANDLPIKDLQDEMNTGLRLLLEVRMQKPPQFRLTEASIACGSITCTHHMYQDFAAKGQPKVPVVHHQKYELIGAGLPLPRCVEGAAVTISMDNPAPSTGVTAKSPRLVAAEVTTAAKEPASASGVAHVASDAPTSITPPTSPSAPGEQKASKVGASMETQPQMNTIMPYDDLHGYDHQLAQLAMRVEERIGRIVHELVYLLVPAVGASAALDPDQFLGTSLTPEQYRRPSASPTVKVSEGRLRQSNIEVPGGDTN